MTRKFLFLLLITLSSPAVYAQTCPGFPSRGVQVIDALYDRTLATGSDDQRRELTRRIIEQLVFEMPNAGWTWKSADPSRPPSKDSIARIVNGRLCNYDWQSGASRERQVNAGTPGEDITGQNPIPVAGVNRLTETPSIPSIPGTPVPVQGQNTEILAQMMIKFEELKTARVASDNFVQLAYQDVLANLNEVKQQNEMLKQQLEKHDQSPSWLGKVMGNRYVQLGLAGLTTVITTRAMSGNSTTPVTTVK
jgi:hypothetical protein